MLFCYVLTRYQNYTPCAPLALSECQGWAPYQTTPAVNPNLYDLPIHQQNSRGNIMSAITEWLEENGITQQTLELLDHTLKGTKQTKLEDWGAIPGVGKQTKLDLK